MSDFIKIVNLTKEYILSEEKILKAVHNVSLDISKGDIYGIMGLSGAGKSTLIRLMNRLEDATSGEIIVNEKNILEFDEFQLREYRKKVGMIFQHFNLLSSRTVEGNVAFALEIAGWNVVDRKARVDELLEIVGLTEKKNVYPSQLSGGQKQRVAIARALANNPDILLSDEATSALDPKTTNSILDLLQDINKKFGITVILITHQMEVIRKICNKTAIMSNGEVIEVGKTKDIFMNPQSKIAKEFVSHIIPDEETIIETQKTIGKQVIKLFFDGVESDKSYITELIKRYGVDVNILSGTIDILHDSKVGHLLIEITGDSESTSGSINWLKENKIKVEVV
jgi:D-methionine transport system ATP-binding protein